MKKIITNVLAASALVAVSMTGLAADTVEKQPLLLSSVQLDEIDAGSRRRYGRPPSSTATAEADASASGRRTNTDAFAWTSTRPGHSASYAAASSSSR